MYHASVDQGKWEEHLPVTGGENPSVDGTGDLPIIEVKVSRRGSVILDFDELEDLKILKK